MIRDLFSLKFHQDIAQYYVQLKKVLHFMVEYDTMTSAVHITLVQLRNFTI